MQCNRLQATVQDVAREAQVSVATVSRVFNTPETVSQQTRQRVLKIAAEIGYLRNESARINRIIEEEFEEVEPEDWR